MQEIKTLRLTTDKPKKEFSLLNSISYIEIMEIRCLHLSEDITWHQELMKNPVRLKIELTCHHVGPKASFEILLSSWMQNTKLPYTIFDENGIIVPKEDLRLPKEGSNVSHYDKMTLTLIQNDSHSPVNIEFLYKDFLKIPAFSVRCFKCRNRSDYRDSEIEWEVEDVNERQMGIETMYSGEFNSNCNYCDNPLSVQFYYWEYPSNILNYHEHKAENCMVVENPNFLERHFEETD